MGKEKTPLQNAVIKIDGGVGWWGTLAKESPETVYGTTTVQVCDIPELRRRVQTRRTEERCFDEVLLAKQRPVARPIHIRLFNSSAIALKTVQNKFQCLVLAIGKISIGKADKYFLGFPARLKEKQRLCRAII